MFYLYWKWLDLDNNNSNKIPNNIIKGKKILHQIRSSWKQNVNFMKRYYKKCQILTSLKNVSNSVKKLTILKVFGLTSKICHHSILLTNQNTLRFFFVYSILGYLFMKLTFCFQLELIRCRILLTFLILSGISFEVLIIKSNYFQYRWNNRWEKKLNLFLQKLNHLKKAETDGEH